MSYESTPSAENLLLGAGQVFFNRFDDEGDPTGLLHLGNCETFELTTEDDVLDKNESMTRARALYKRVTRKRTPTLRLTMDEFYPDNVALALMGEKVQSAAQAATAVVAEAVAATTVPGSYFTTAKLGPITGVSVDFGATPGVLGTDYEITDPDVGVIRILPDTILTGAVTIDYTPTAYATGLTQIRGGTKNQVRGSVLFLGDPAVGPRVKVEIWQASVNPDGAVGLISEEWSQMGITLAVESDVVNHPLEALYRLTYLPF